MAQRNGRTVRIEDAPMEQFNMWMEALIEEEPAYRGWLKIELAKRFPEFDEWLKKRDGRLVEDSTLPDEIVA